MYSNDTAAHIQYLAVFLGQISIKDYSGRDEEVSQAQISYPILHMCPKKNKKIILYREK